MYSIHPPALYLYQCFLYIYVLTYLSFLNGVTVSLFFFYITLPDGKLEPPRTKTSGPQAPKSTEPRCRGHG